MLNYSVAELRIKAITVFLYELECNVVMTMQTFVLFFHAFFSFRIIYIFNKFLN